MRPGAASREYYLFSDTFPGVSCFVRLSDFFCFPPPPFFFWMRLLLLMHCPDLSQSTLKAGKGVKLGFGNESGVNAIVLTHFKRVQIAWGQGAYVCVNVHIFDALRMIALSMSICCESLLKQKKLRIIRSLFKSTFLDILKPISEKDNQSIKKTPTKQKNQTKQNQQRQKPISTKNNNSLF